MKKPPSRAARWVVVNRETGKVVERFGRHGSEAAARVMLDAFIEAFEVDVREGSRSNKLSRPISKFTPQSRLT